MNVEQNFKKIEISLSCRKLKNLDTFSKSDPFIIFYMKSLQNNQWVNTGRTETLKDNLNPNFKKSFIVDYIFEFKQECKFEIHDDDGHNSSELVGEAYSTIGAIVGAKNNIFITEIKSQKGNKSTGTLVVISEATQECKEFIFMQWEGKKLKNVDGWFDKSDPFLRFKRIREDKNEIVCHETEQIMDNLNPVWKPFEISGQKLYNGDQYRPIKCECWDWEKNQQFQFIGEFQFNVQELIQGKRQFDLVDKKQKKTGIIQLAQFQIQTRPTFLDYIRGNTQLNVVLAVDFTASNGAVSTPQSLHYISPNNAYNQYQQAIVTVGEILLDYDFDKKVPCFGFGGHPKYPNLRLGGVSHCFPMSGDAHNTEACGVNEIMNLYRYSLTNVSLSGPTLFNPILQETLKMTNICKMQGSVVYTVLLIITDGEIHDMDDTLCSVVEASNQPLSIIIVGVGNANFGGMERLDGDKGLLYSPDGKKATRDVVQFVPFRNVNGNPVVLAQQVLAEIPDQLVKYMMSQGIKPVQLQGVNISQVCMGQSSQCVISDNTKNFGQNLINQGEFIQQGQMNQTNQQTYQQSHHH